MKKTTREYADHLSRDYFSYSENSFDTFETVNHKRSGFISGYQKAIEENAVPELIEAAELALSHLVYSHSQKPFAFPKGENSIEKLRAVLNKINQ